MDQFKHWKYENTAKANGLVLWLGKRISTCDPGYYKFEQKMFLDFYKSGIAYKKET